MKNYITKNGWQKLSGELCQLVHHERQKIVEIVSWAAKNGDRSENGDYLYGKNRLREIDRRIRFLTKQLENAEVVETTHHQNNPQIFFGATVTIKRNDQTLQTVTIVGMDESDAQQGYISWISPLARALLRASIGDSVRFNSPNGVENIQIIQVSYNPTI